MKCRQILFIFFILLSHKSFSLTADSNKINAIRKMVRSINADTSYVIKKLENEDFMDQATDRGGHLEGYFKKGKLVKIVEWVGVSSCINVTEYYLQNEKLIFAYTKGFEFQYVDSIATFNSNQILTMECRFYFENNKMIKSILKGATRCGGAALETWAKTDIVNTAKYRH